MTAKSKAFSIVGPLEFDKSSGEPGVHIGLTWHGAFDLMDAIWAGIGGRNREGETKAADFARQQQVEPMKFASEPIVPSKPSYETGMNPWQEDLWAYRNKVVRHRVHTFNQPDLKETALLVKHCVLLEEAAMEKVRREVKAFENFERVPLARRERIPPEVQMFVWQRDEGKCTQCGGRERLEYDHIIPVIEGGSSTTRNIQLLCESCNRSKGRSV